MDIEGIRKIFETFDGPSAFKKDQYMNYDIPVVHNIWVGFKSWMVMNESAVICLKCTRQLSGHNFKEKCSIWCRCTVIKCDDFQG